MFIEVPTKKFKQELRKINRQNKDISKIIEVIDKIRNEQKLEEKYKDHSLQGNYIGCRECHIEPNWLLIYGLDTKQNKLYLLRTGSHSELFKEDYEYVHKMLDKILNE